jgi:Holliday junction DNA helicase RuvA
LYAYLKGTLAARLNDSIVVENNNIGYQVQAAPELLERFGAVGKDITVFTYLHVREDILMLYGFPTQEDRSMFELLITVSGIGPKVASAMVGTLTPGEFALAVITGDIKTITRVRGVGKKGAERLILELKDKIKGAEGLEPTAAAGTGGAAAAGRTLSRQQEAISALMVLGYSSGEASQAIKAVDDGDQELEELIKLGLRQMMK